MCLLVGGLGLCVLAAPGAAQPADALQRAQAAFDQAQIDYLAGKYDEAARGFQEAFAARQFPQFLYNAGASFHMKAKKDGRAESYAQAVDLYRRYLAAAPQAADKAKVEKAIGVLEAETQRLRAQPAPQGKLAPAARPSRAVQQLGDARPRSIVVIESEPPGATIYLDDRRSGPFGTTPWSGPLEGKHKVIVEKRGFMVSESAVTGDPKKLFVLRAVLGPEAFLGWIEITANVPGAAIYLDDKGVGVIAKTPHQQNIKPGKHTFWISAEGYDEERIEIEVTPGGTHEVKAQLKGLPVGRLTVTGAGGAGGAGAGIEGSKISINGEVACEQGPCSKLLPPGEHTVRVERAGKTPYQQRVTVQVRSDTTIKVSLAKRPGRVPLVVASLLAVGLGGSGVFLGLQAKRYRDDLRAEIAAADPPVDSRDDRFGKGERSAIAADVTFALAGVSAAAAVYFALRSRGRPSVGQVDVGALALRPQIGPGYAGLGAGARW